MKILDYERSHFGCVYCLEFPNGMRYVGKTHDVGGRVGLYKRFGEGGKVNGAIKEFGIENVDMRILVRWGWMILIRLIQRERLLKTLITMTI